ncbi:MAG: hypothetical protein KDC98_00755 [Planctomycetes bacterium]|nr:hypothetical protein [Planctomycetota bacterium]
MNANQKALLRKDSLWIWWLAIAGLIALVIAAGDRSWFGALCFSLGYPFNVFTTAWIGGLVLGLCAACFDGVLGVGDYLRQRPLAAAELFAARLRGIVIVLAVWLLGMPLGSWLCMAVSETAAMPDASAVGRLVAAAVPAVSAAAIGLFAGMLPVAFWMRPLVAGAGLLVCFSGAYRLFRMMTGSSFTDPVWFGVCHLAIAVVCTAAARAVGATQRDPDVAWPARLRHGPGLLASILVVGTLAGGMAGAEEMAWYWLGHEYPTVVIHGDATKLAVRDDLWRGREVRLVGPTHQPQQPRVARAEVEALRLTMPMVDREWLGFDPPQWHRGLDVAWLPGENYIVQLLHDGRVYLRSHDRFYDLQEPVGKGSPSEPFEAPSWAFSPRGSGRWALIFEPAARRAWRFDPPRRAFVEVVPPGGDRLQNVEWSRGRYSPELLGDDSVVLLVGEAGVYTERDGQLIAVTAESEAVGDQRPEVATDGSPLSFVARVEGAGDRPAFEHEFRPRTFFEYLYAGAALACAAVQPLPFNFVGRSGLVMLLSVLLSALTGLASWRRLGRLGAPVATRRLWLVLGFVLGPLSLLPSLVLEPARAYAVRPRVLAPEPRIGTALREVSA